MSENETSIRAVIECPRGGRIVTMGFPGLILDGAGGAFVDPERLSETLDHESLSNCALMIALAEAEETPEDAFPLLAQALSARGVGLEHLPIADYAAPSAAFEAGWSARAAIRHGMLDAQGSIGICCHYGAGRSGTVAALLLIERGLPPEEAVARVRRAFPESIESAGQLEWLRARGGRPRP